MRTSLRLGEQTEKGGPGLQQQHPPTAGQPTLRPFTGLASCPPSKLSESPGLDPRNLMKKTDCQ